MNYRIGICDRDTSYMVKFMEYINMHESIPLRVSAFSSEHALDEYSGSSNLDLVVLGEGVEIHSDRIPKLYIRDRIEAAGQEQSIYKYQGMEVIAEQIVLSINKIHAQRKHAHEKKLYGVYSPIGRCGKTRFAMGICEYYKSSLYIGMEEYCGIPLPAQYGHSQAGEQFLYYVANRSIELADWLEGLKCEGKSFCVIPGCRSYMDIRQLVLNDMEWLRAFLLKKTSYSRVVFDVGAGTLNDIKILHFTDKIFVPIIRDEISMEKLNSFKSILREEAYCDLEKKITYVSVPDVPYDSSRMRDTIEEVICDGD